MNLSMVKEKSYSIKIIIGSREISLFLSLSEDIIPPLLKDAVLRKTFILCLIFCAYILLFKNIINSTKNQNYPHDRRKKKGPTIGNLRVSHTFMIKKLIHVECHHVNC